MLNWIKHQRKLLNAGGMKEERVALFEKLQELAEQYKRINQSVRTKVNRRAGFCCFMGGVFL